MRREEQQELIDLSKRVKSEAENLLARVISWPIDMDEDPRVPAREVFTWVNSPIPFTPSISVPGKTYIAEIPDGIYTRIEFSQKITVRRQLSRRMEGVWIGIGGNDKQVLFLGFFDRQRIRFTQGFKPKHDHKNKITVTFPFPRSVGSEVFVDFWSDTKLKKAKVTLSIDGSSVSRALRLQEDLDSFVIDREAKRNLLINNSYQHTTENEKPSIGWIYEQMEVSVYK